MNPHVHMIYDCCLQQRQLPEPPGEPSLSYSLRQELNDMPIELQERLVKWRQEEFSEGLVRDSYGFLHQGGSPELGTGLDMS